MPEHRASPRQAHRTGPACFVRARLNSELPLAQMYLISRSVCVRHPVAGVSESPQPDNLQEASRQRCRTPRAAFERTRQPHTFCFTTGDRWFRRLIAESTKPFDTSAGEVCTSSQISSRRYTAAACRVPVCHPSSAALLQQAHPRVLQERELAQQAAPGATTSFEEVASSNLLWLMNLVNMAHGRSGAHMRGPKHYLQKRVNKCSDSLVTTESSYSAALATERLGLSPLSSAQRDRTGPRQGTKLGFQAVGKRQGHEPAFPLPAKDPGMSDELENELLSALNSSDSEVRPSARHARNTLVSCLQAR